MKIIKLFKEKQYASMQKDIKSNAIKDIKLVDFDNKLYIAFYDVPILSIDPKWTQEDILKKLEEVRNTYIKYYTQKLNYGY